MKSLHRFTRSVVDVVRSLPHMDEHPDHSHNANAAVPNDIDGYRSSGTWTFLGMWLIMVTFAVLSGGFGLAWTAITGFFSFDLDALRQMDNSLATLLSLMAALLAIEVPITILIGVWLKKRYGDPKSHKVMKVFSGIKRHNLRMTVIVVTEEVLARWLLLGLPLLLMDGNLSTVAFYLLFLLGNVPWALVHLGNYDDKSERQLVRVLPQFLGGIPLAIVFVNFGLLGSILVHLAFNYLMMSAMRKGIFNKGEVLVILWHSLVAFVSFALLVWHSGKSLLDLLHWFDRDASNFAIPGWELPHYLLAALLVASVTTVIAELLLFDLHPTQIEAAGLDGVGRAIAIMGLSFVAFFGLGYINVPFDVRVLIMALVFLLARKSASGSGMSRVFWIGLPVLMFQLCAILALGWNSAVWLIALAVAFADLPDRWLRIQDAKWEGRPLEEVHPELLPDTKPSEPSAA